MIVHMMLILNYYSHLWHVPVQTDGIAHWVQARGVTYGITPTRQAWAHVVYQQIKGMRVESVKLW